MKKLTAALLVLAGTLLFALTGCSADTFTEKSYTAEGAVTEIAIDVEDREVTVIASEDGTEFAFRTVQTNDGKEWLVAFTSPSEFQKGQPSQIVSNFIDAMLKACLDTENPGFIINPWGESFMLTADLIDMIIKADGGVEYSVPDDTITPKLLKDGSFLKRATSP